MGKTISSWLEEKFKSVIRIIIASLKQLVSMVCLAKKNPSKTENYDIESA